MKIRGEYGNFIVAEMPMCGGERRSAAWQATCPKYGTPYGRKPARTACRLGAGTFGFQAGAAMRKDLAAAVAIPSMRGIEGL
jgi:hypothetical protein